MLEATLILCVLLVAFINEASGRGIRIQGVSWFEIAQERRGMVERKRKGLRAIR